jgi:hypothetical protein
MMGKVGSGFVPILSENAVFGVVRKSFCSRDFQIHINHIRPRGGVVTQRSAKPRTSPAISALIPTNWPLSGASHINGLGIVQEREPGSSLPLDSYAQRANHPTF